MVISIEKNNQRLIILAHNSVFYLKTKYINIQYYYICDKMVLKKNKLFYISTNQIIRNGLIKTLANIKFYCSINSIYIS